MSSKLRGPRTLHAAISVIASLMLVLAMAGGVAAAADDASGTMTVNTTTAAGGVGGQAFTFDFTNIHADDFAASSQVVLTIPAGWTLPQNANAANPGYVTVVEGSYSGTNTCDPGTVVIGGMTITIPQTCGHDDHLTITYGNVKPPVTAGQPQAYPFSTQTRDGSETLTSIQTSPIITVDTLAITFYKEVCSRYSDVPANRLPGSSDATGGHSADLDTGYQTAEASPADRPAACAASKGWLFQLREGNNGTLIQTVTTGDDGSHTVYLGSTDIAWARGSGVWVNEVLSPAVAGFGALRCYRDVLNGDNLDYVGGVPTGTNQAYCLSYNVRQTITFTTAAPGGATVGGATYTPAATASSGLTPVDLTIDLTSNGVCSITGGVVSFTGAGTCKINANQVGQATSPFWTPAAQVQQSFGVGKANQTISWTSTAPVGATVGGSYPAAAASSAGLTPVDLTIDATSTAGACSINGVGLVSFTGVGTCVVDANQVGDLTHNAALQIQQSFEIGPATPVISFTSNPGSPVVGGPAYTVTATSPSPATITFGLDGTSTGCSLVGVVVSYTGVGTCKINANQPATTNWSPAAQVQQSFGVGKANQTIINFGPFVDMTYGDGPITLGASATSGLDVAYTASGACSVIGNILTITGVGSCSVTASQGGDGTYNPAESVVRTFNIGPGGLDHIAIKPKTATIVAGATQAYTAEAFDIGGNSLGDVTGSTVFTIGSDASCTAAVCTSNTAAVYTVTGTYVGKTDTAALTVTVGGFDHFVISPSPKTIVAGATQAYTAEAFDIGGNSLGDVTASTTFSIDGLGSSCAVDKCGSSVVGDYTVTGTYNGEWTATAVLHVTAVPPTAAPSAAPTATPVEQVGGATAAPTVAPSEQVAAVTASPVRAVTPPPTSTNDNSSNSGSLPLMLILIALALGGLGMLAVQAQRRTIRR